MGYKIKVPNTRTKTITTKFNVDDIVALKIPESNKIYIAKVEQIRIYDNGDVRYFVVDERRDDEYLSLAE